MPSEMTMLSFHFAVMEICHTVRKTRRSSLDDAAFLAFSLLMSRFQHHQAV
jgi:hypothetical protein